MMWILLILPLTGGVFSLITASDFLRRILLQLVSVFYLGAVIMIWKYFPYSPAPEDLLGIDPLSLLFLFITALLFLPVAFYTAGYLSHGDSMGKKNRAFSREAVFTALLQMFLSTMTLSIISRHPGVFWIAIEATTLASAPLISFHRSAYSLEASWKYLLICSVGIALALTGNIFLSVSASFVPSLGSLPHTFEVLFSEGDLLQPVWLKGAFIFTMIGYGTKMGLVPMHTWLPDAHSQAPSPVSALLSGALLNCAMLGILRFHNLMKAAGLFEFSSSLLTVFGVFSVILAGWFIVNQNDYKRLLAYSSIEHVGIMSIAAGSSVYNSYPLVIHAFNHSLTKGLLFLAAGNILSFYKTKNVKEVGGVLGNIPLTGVMWTGGFLAICGFPPSGIFISEFSIIKGLINGGGWITLSLLLVSLSVIFIGMARAVTDMSFGTPASKSAEPFKGRFYSSFPLVFLFVIIVVSGFWIPAPVGSLFKAAAFVIGG